MKHHHTPHPHHVATHAVTAVRARGQKAIVWLSKHRSKLIAAFCLVVGLGGGFFVGSKTYAPVTIQHNRENVSVADPIAFSLNQTLGNIKTTDIRVHPAVTGKWQYERGNVLAGDKLIFTPSTSFKENTRYTVTLPNGSRLLSGTASLPKVQFLTEKAPQVSDQGMARYTDAQVVAADATFSVTLASANHGMRQLELRATPAIALKPASENDTTFTWKSVETLPQGSEIALELHDIKNDEILLKKTIRVAAEPTPTTPEQRGNVDEKDVIPITFADPVEQPTAKITFDLPGKGSWQNETTYLFSPDKLLPATTYNYTIAKGLRTKPGGILLGDRTGSFTTIGPIAVVGTSPQGRNLAQAQQTLSFTFSRPVDRASAEQRLSVSSGNVTGLSWNGNTLYATVANIGYQQNFSATIAPGVVNASFGAPSNRSYSLSFTTEVRSVKLNVPFYHQQYAASCAGASLRMILAYRGIYSDDFSIIQHMGYNPRSRDDSTNPPTWDDPSQMFVGDINGSIIKGTGAGPDAPPVAKAARSLGRNASAVTGIGVGWIADQIYAGNPVAMFGAWRATGNLSWKTPSGRDVVMNRTSHITVVTGVVGEPSNPLGFWVSDPLTGGNAYWSTGAVASNIARDPYRQAVVVY